MLECNRMIHKKLTALVRLASLLLPLACAVLLLSQVVFAKNTFVINDGDRVLIHTTYAKDPTEVLEEAGLELGAQDTYTTNSTLGKSEITIQRQQTVTVICGGHREVVTTYGETVESLLEGVGLLPGELDMVSVPLNAQTQDGMTITVTRCVELEMTYTVTVPFGTLYMLDPSLFDGEERVLMPGIEGQTQKTDRVSYLDGKEVGRYNLTHTDISVPVSQIVAVKTLEGIDPEQIFVPGAETAPESNMGNGQLQIGNGLIRTPDGQILTYTDTMKVVATAYHNSDPGCTIWTAIGTLCRVGAIAVDPKVIPYGTRMYIVTDDGQYIYGTAVAEDCGSAIKGNRVDLYFDTVAECWKFGIRNATIYFLG